MADVPRRGEARRGPPRHGRADAPGQERPGAHLQNDPRRIAPFYGIPNEALVALFLEPPNGLDGALVRNDYIDTPEGLKILEVNAGSVGGWLFGYLEGHFRANPLIARFLQEEGVDPRYRDPLEEMLLHIITDNLGRPFAAGGVLNVVIAVDEPGLANDDARISRLYRDLLAARGLTGEVVLCPYGDLTVRQNQVWYQDGRRQAHAIVEISPQNSPEGLYRCFKMGRVSLYKARSIRSSTTSGTSPCCPSTRIPTSSRRRNETSCADTCPGRGW